MLIESTNIVTELKIIIVNSSPRCTFVYGTPTMYIDMLGQRDLAQFDLSSVGTGESIQSL